MADQRRFEVAFSFPGEHRDVIAEIVRLLAPRLGNDKILYDKLYEEEFAQPNLDVYLPQLYCDESELVVVLLCAEYDKKVWTGLEWRQARQLIAKKEPHRLLLLKADDIPIQEFQGLTAGDGWVDIRKHSPKDLARLIEERLQRIAIKTRPKVQDSVQFASSVAPANSRRQAVIYSLLTASVTFLGLAAAYGHLRLWGPTSNGDSNVGGALDALNKGNAAVCASTALFFLLLFVIDFERNGSRGFDAQMRFGVIIPLLVAYCIWTIEYTGVLPLEYTYAEALLFTYGGLVLLSRPDRAHQMVKGILPERGETSGGLGVGLGLSLVAGVVFLALVIGVGLTGGYKGKPPQGYALATTGVIGLATLSVGLAKALNRRSWDLNTMLPSILLALMAFVQTYLVWNPQRSDTPALVYVLLLAYSLKLCVLFALIIVTVATIKMYQERKALMR